MVSDALRSAIHAYVRENADRMVLELRRFLQQKSISTENVGMEECAKFLKDELLKLGLRAVVAELPGAMPAVWAKSDRSSGPRIVVYGHYDVQSPDPLDLWDSPPFAAEVRDGVIYARGATDDKGNIWANIKAVEVLKAVLGEVPVSLRFLFEGEEEIGSPNLARYMRDLSGEISADIGIVCDRGIHETGRPQLYLGNKGILSLEIAAKRAKRDVHSGHAPLIPNAAYDLMCLITSMRSKDGTILIDGYLENVKGPDSEERALLSSIPFDRQEFMREYGISANLGPQDAGGMLERLLYYPTANVSGFKSGWMGERGRTIIPHEARARMDFRLVHAQTVKEAREKIAEFIRKSPYGPFEVSFGDGNEEYKVSPQLPAVRAAMENAARVYGLEPVVWPLLDGSGPLYLFPRHLGCPVFMIGLGAPFSTANTHAPNENISVDQYLKGIKQMANLLVAYAELM